MLILLHYSSLKWSEYKFMLLTFIRLPNVYLLNIVSTVLKFTSRLQMNVITLLGFSYSYLNLILILIS